MLSLKTESANILRVYNTGYVRPSTMGNIDGYAYGGNNAISLRGYAYGSSSKSFRVIALYYGNLLANGNYAS